MDEKNITIIFEKSKNYQTYPATGAWGGVSPDGSSFVVNFYVESHSIPNYLQVPVKDDESINPNEGERINRGDFLREIQTTIVMNLETAKKVAEWITKHLENYENRRNSNE